MATPKKESLGVPPLTLTRGGGRPGQVHDDPAYGGRVVVKGVGKDGALVPHGEPKL